MKAKPRRFRWFLLCPFILVVLCFSVTVNVSAEIFKFVDKDGVINFTNVPTRPDAKKLPDLSAFMIPRATVARTSSSRPGFSECRTADRDALEPSIRLICRRHGLDSNLVKAVIHAESAFNSEAVSPKGAMGLMQLMPDTSRDMGVIDPFDPSQNIEGGVRYLRLLMDRFDNNLEFALAAYNAGPEKVSKYGGIPPYDETQTYVHRVLDYYSRYSR